jgi:hypothetical protein
MLGFHRQDITINSIAFVWLSVVGGLTIVDGDTALGIFFISLSLINLWGHYDYPYLIKGISKFINWKDKKKIILYLSWRYYEELGEDIQPKPKKRKPSLSKELESYLDNAVEALIQSGKYEKEKEKTCDIKSEEATSPFD